MQGDKKMEVIALVVSLICLSNIFTYHPTC
jgi:hypothetical protein